MTPHLWAEVEKEFDEEEKVKKQTGKDRLLNAARKMPPLHHKLSGEDFDWMKSETVKWLVSQPEILDFIWRSVRDKTGENTLISYNPDTGKWQGVDYDGN